MSEQERDELEPTVPTPGFGVSPRSARVPGFDPSLSPLTPGGHKDSPEPIPADSNLHGLTATPRQMRGTPRVTYRVRREGWVARRQAARNRFGHLNETRSSSIPRFLRGLRDRGGLLQRSKKRAVRARFDDMRW